jgi:hypothetical protein
MNSKRRTLLSSLASRFSITYSHIPKKGERMKKHKLRLLFVVSLANLAFAYDGTVHPKITEQAIQFLKANKPSYADALLTSSVNGTTFHEMLIAACTEPDNEGKSLTNDEINGYSSCPYYNFEKSLNKDIDAAASALFSDRYPFMAMNVSDKVASAFGVPTFKDIAAIGVRTAFIQGAGSSVDKLKCATQHTYVTGEGMFGGAFNDISIAPYCAEAEYNMAVEAWQTGDRAEAMRRLGRVLHYVQDITVPHHISLDANIPDIVRGVVEYIRVGSDNIMTNSSQARYESAQANTYMDAFNQVDLQSYIPQMQNNSDKTTSVPDILIDIRTKIILKSECIGGVDGYSNGGLAKKGFWAWAANMWYTVVVTPVNAAVQFTSEVIAKLVELKNALINYARGEAGDLVQGTAEEYLNSVYKYKDVNDDMAGVAAKLIPVAIGESALILDKFAFEVGIDPLGDNSFGFFSLNERPTITIYDATINGSVDNNFMITANAGQIVLNPASGYRIIEAKILPTVSVDLALYDNQMRYQQYTVNIGRSDNEFLPYDAYYRKVYKVPSARFGGISDVRDASFKLYILLDLGNGKTHEIIKRYLPQVQRVSLGSIDDAITPLPDIISDAIMDQSSGATLNFITGGVNNWCGTSASSTRGGSCVESPSVNHNESAWFTTQVDGATITFDAQTETENNYDWLNVYADGVKIYRLSGANSWRTITLPLAYYGMHTISFEYSKDGSVAVGQDKVWIDNLIATAIPGQAGVFPNPNRDYKIVSSSNPGLALDINASGAIANRNNIQVWTYGNGTNQQWKVKYNNDGTCFLVSRYSPSFVADVTLDSPMNNGSNVYAITNLGTNNQKWVLANPSSNCYVLSTLANTALCLDVDNIGGVHDGSNAQVWSYGGGANQQWQFVEVP